MKPPRRSDYQLHIEYRIQTLFARHFYVFGKAVEKYNLIYPN